ncbi:hypothetical protein [Thermus brevis]|uniref:hypothetical protein n=1 Tax=Thermus brevis TaxID=2862456 RepID=UPI001FE51639|nr:hypothetical protein [Thermus brevis]
MTTAEALGHGRSPHLAAYLKERQRKALGHKLAALTEVLKRAGKARLSPGQPQGGYLEAYQLLEEGRRDRP